MIANTKLAEKVNTAIFPYTKGYYMNEIDLELAPYMAKSCFSTEKWKKLNTLRKAYDPENRFFGYLGQD